MSEAERILRENQRRESELDSTLYAAWQPAELFMRQGRERAAVGLLRTLDVFPVRGDRCLEIGYGTRGWLPTLIGWGLDAADLYGIELDRSRAELASPAIPGSHLKVGDAVDLPWEDGYFQLVVLSTVLTSILDSGVRQAVSKEVERVLSPGGGVLVYDFRVDNPSNPHVRRLGRAGIRSLFPRFKRAFRSVTLAPPLTRAIAPVSWSLATLLEGLPFLRSHLVAVMIKPEGEIPRTATHA